MKKAILPIVCSLVFLLTSCSKDDVDDNCESCSKGPISIDLCNNGDGTYSLNGGEPMKIPRDSSFEEIVENACVALKGS